MVLYWPSSSRSFLKTSFPIVPVMSIMASLLKVDPGGQMDWGVGGDHVVVGQ